MLPIFLFRNWILYFNSIKVRLERSLSGGCSLVSRFQFHKGAIRTYIPADLSLEQYTFQFHKGAIRTFQMFYNIYLLIPFQFHKGAIRTVPYPVGAVWYLDFNSIKVRLEQGSLSAALLLPIFQFHKGAIRTIKSRASIDELVNNFNSIKVRLELSVL